MVAPIKTRLKRVMESENIDESSAQSEITRFDKGTHAFIKRYFHAGLEDPAYYDLVINTGHLSFRAAVSIVVDALPFKDQTLGE